MTVNAMRLKWHTGIPLQKNRRCDQQTERNKSLDNLKKIKQSKHEGQVSYKWPNLSKL